MLIAHIHPFLSAFLLSYFCLFAFKNLYHSYYGTIKARTLKLGIHKDNELLYCGI